MKKIMLISPDGTKTYIDADSLPGFTEEDIMAFLMDYFNQIDEDELSLLVSEKLTSTDGKQIFVVPNLERYMLLSEMKNSDIGRMTSENVQAMLDEDKQRLIN